MKYTLLIIALSTAAVLLAVDLASPSNHTDRNSSDFLTLYNETRDELIAEVSNSDPGRALSMLKTIAEEKGIGLDFCHPLSHEIGNAAVKKYDDFGEAIKYFEQAADYCAAGYVHGVFEQYIGTLDDLSSLKTLCDQYEHGDLARVYRECVHGGGHGLMFYTANDLPKSIELCEEIFHPDTQDCVGGAYMENFNVTLQAGHQTDYIRDDNLFYPCDEAGFGYKGQCYTYAVDNYLNHNPKDYSGLLEWCLQAGDDSAKSSCFKMAGQRILQNKLNNPKEAEQLCASVPSEHLRQCVSGMAYGYQAFYVNRESGKEFCQEILSSEYRELCPGVFK